jgi:serine/threonine protein kinase
MALEPGKRLGPYEIVSPIGAGGMGEVYRACDSRLGHDVAVKVLPADVATDPERLRRFEQEARAVGALSHPNILSVFDIGETDGVRFMVIELLEGETIRERMGGAPTEHLRQDCPDSRRRTKSRNPTEIPPQPSLDVELSSV